MVCIVAYFRAMLFVYQTHSRLYTTRSTFMEPEDEAQRAAWALPHFRSRLQDNVPASRVTSLTVEFGQATRSAQKSVRSVLSLMFAETQPAPFPWMSSSYFMDLIESSRLLVYNVFNDGVAMTEWAGSNVYPDISFYSWQDLLYFIPKTCTVKIKNSTTVGVFFKWHRIKL